MLEWMGVVCLGFLVCANQREFWKKFEKRNMDLFFYTFRLYFIRTIYRLIYFVRKYDYQIILICFNDRVCFVHSNLKSIYIQVEQILLQIKMGSKWGIKGNIILSCWTARRAGQVGIKVTVKDNKRQSLLTCTQACNDYISSELSTGFLVAYSKPDRPSIGFELPLNTDN